MATSNEYWNVVTNEGEEQATIYLYGYIGQDLRWAGEEYAKETLTDLAVVQKIHELEKSYSRINLRINSYGGSVFHGEPMVQAIRDSKAEIHTYNDGIAASMGAVIWAAGHKRHMGMNSKLMFHNVSTTCFGNAMDLLKVAEVLDKMDEITIEALAVDTSLSAKEIRSRFYNYEDNWLSSQEALDLGFIAEIEDYPTSEKVENPEKLAYADLVAACQKPQSQASSDKTFLEKATDFLQRLTQKRATPPDPAPEDLNKTSIEMNLEQFKTSLGEELPETAVVEELQARGYTVTKAAADPAPAEPDTDVVALLKQVVDPLQAQIKELQAQVKAYGDLPGAAPSDTASNADAPDGLNTGTETYDAIKALADKAIKGERVDTSGRL